MHGLFENAIYGGRVDNIWDGKVLSAYLQIFFNNEMVGGRKPTATQLIKNFSLPTTVNYQVGILFWAVQECSQGLFRAGWCLALLIST